MRLSQQGGQKVSLLKRANRWRYWKQRALDAEKKLAQTQEALRFANHLNDNFSLKWHRCTQHINLLNKAHLKWIRRAKNYKTELDKLKGEKK
jgi:hypothetical protein